MGQGNRPPLDVESLYRDAPCGLLVTGADGVIQWVNQTFCAWIGWAADELLGRKRLQDLLTVGGRIFHQTHWVPLMQIQGSVAEVKLDILHRDGRKLPTVWNAVRREREGQVLHEVAVFVAEDRHKYEQELVLARRRAEELLAKEQAAQQALLAVQAERDRQQALAQDRALFAEQMMAVVSHDLRNPLSVIRMSAFILAKSGLSPMQESALSRLTSSNARAMRLISDLLDFSRGRIGKGLQIDLEEIHPHAVVDEALADLRVAFPDRLIEHLRLGEGACLGDSDRLTQLIGNLVSNAVAYGTRGSSVAVASSIENEVYTVSVHNLGTPIPGDLLPRLFDPMTRGVSAASHANSVGLSLFIVRQIAQAHGGRVDVESRSEGGTTFRAVFPRRQEVGQAPAAAPSALTPKDGEPFRQFELARLAISRAAEPAYDDITRFAAESFDAPMAAISLVGMDRPWFKSHVGLHGVDAATDFAFCAQAMQTPGEVLCIEDAAADPRFASNPLVTRDAGVRFYAGAPLVTSAGAALGTVCVMDRRPRRLEPKQLELLQFLAQQVVARFEEQRKLG